MTPVFINVFNRVTTTRNLADQVSRLPGAVPILVDNNSDWPELLEWYATCPYDVVRLTQNLGHHAPWSLIPGPAEFQRKYGGRHYVVTDCDLDIGECPLDVLDVLRLPLSPRSQRVKCGLSLRIDDLPEWQAVVRGWESRFWKHSIADGRYYIAPVDTTFAMYDCFTPHFKATRVAGVQCLRSATPYTARHVPWYLNAEQLDAENAHYFATANTSNSWRPSGKGLAAGYAPSRHPGS